MSLDMQEECYPGMSYLEILVIQDMYSQGKLGHSDWFDLSDKDKEVISQGFWLQYIGDVAEDMY